LSQALAASSGDEQNRLRALKRSLKEKEEAYHRLVDGIEKGIVPLHDMTRQRIQAHEPARTEVLLELGRVEARRGPGFKAQSPRHVRAFTAAVRNRLLDSESGFRRAYLSLLVQKITVGPETLSIQGRKDVLAAAIADRALSADSVRSSMP